jgi:hypothetical protein
MKATAGVLVAAALILAFGCARPDWIQQTLVTENLTGTWESSDYIFIEIALEQQGQKVTGSVLKPRHLSGAIEGTMTGDEFRFQRKNGIFEGQMSVSGDEMSGTLRAVVGSAGPGYARATPVMFRRTSPIPAPNTPQQ